MAMEKMKKAAKMVQAKLSGEAGILATLQGEHGEVSALMEKILADQDDVGTRERHYPTIREKLLVHARAEQEVFYPACDEVPELRDQIRDDLREHQEIEQCVAELDDRDLGSKAWMQSFERLHDVVEHHVADEEGELFPRCQELFPRERLKRMDDAYMSVKMQLKEAGLTPRP